MSYILDALKKSEQERGHGSAPSVQTLHTLGISYHASKTHLWPYLLLAAIVINLGALMYFIVADDRAEPGVEAVVDGPGPEHRRVRRQRGVGAHHPGALGPLRAGVEVRHLAGRVHPGIGAPGAHDRDGLDRDGRRGRRGRRGEPRQLRLGRIGP